MKKELRELTKELFSKYGIEFGGQAFAYGNSKLKQSDMIVNITSAENCPSCTLGMCEHAEHCYAKKCERIYRQYKQKNLAVEEFFKRASNVDKISLIVAYIVNAPIKVKRIRLNEAGDFKDQKDVEFFDYLAGILKKNYGVSVYGWSARTDLNFTDVNFVLNGSTDSVVGADRVFKRIEPKEFDDIVNIFESRLEAEKSLGRKCIALCKGSGGCKHCGICATKNNIKLVWARRH